MATVTPMTVSETLQNEITMYQRTILDELDDYHDETSPAVKIAWDNRKTKNFTNDTAYLIIRHAMSPGGMMPRNYTFTLENTPGPMNAQYAAKIVNAHTAINWFQLQESASEDALYDMVKDQIDLCWRTLWYRLSYMFWSKQNESVTGNTIDANTLYTTFLPDVTIDLVSGAASDMFTGLPLAARGNTATHTYGGLSVTAGSTDNAPWQANVSNDSGATDDHGTSGTGRAVTNTIIQNHVGAGSMGGNRPKFGSMPYNVFTSFSNAVHAMLLGNLREPVRMNAFGVEDAIPFRGCEYYSEPWCTDIHYNSTAGGSVFEWDPDIFYLLLHTSSANPVEVNQISSGNQVQGFQHLERSTILFFGLFLWGEFVTVRRHKLGRINNLL